MLIVENLNGDEDSKYLSQIFMLEVMRKTVAERWLNLLLYGNSWSNEELKQIKGEINAQSSVGR